MESLGAGANRRWTCGERFTADDVCHGTGFRARYALESKENISPKTPGQLRICRCVTTVVWCSCMVALSDKVVAAVNMDAVPYRNM